MKTWRIEIEIDAVDEVTLKDMQEIADKIADDAVMRAEDELPGPLEVRLEDVRNV